MRHHPTSAPRAARHPAVRISRCASAGLLAVALAGCVSPRVVHVYDEKCQVMSRKVELSVEKAQALDACSHQDCVAQIIGSVISLAASTVVSGSVAVVGNVAFWLEKSAQCKKTRGAATAPATAPATAAPPGPAPSSPAPTGTPATAA